MGKTFDSLMELEKNIMKTKREGLQKKISSGGKSSFCQRKLHGQKEENAKFGEQP